eukprot:TRINITY_DN8064_c0_g1_i1.p1 TRINITY_DN8064_c0_g1~~TRINITY_DN8064_c0_g1_i1.p1  ORF type:complete len:264 (+),score=42.17 TRINITY_DN8064_c0_g1_i1:177-968(+)
MTIMSCSFVVDLLIERTHGPIPEGYTCPPTFPSFPCVFSTESHPLTITMTLKSMQDPTRLKCKLYLARDDYTAVKDGIKRKDEADKVTHMHMQRCRNVFTSGRIGFACTFVNAYQMRGQIFSQTQRGLLHFVVTVEYGIHSFNCHLPEMWVFSKAPGRQTLYEMTCDVINNMNITTLTCTMLADPLSSKGQKFIRKKLYASLPVSVTPGNEYVTNVLEKDPTLASSLRGKAENIGAYPQEIVHQIHEAEEAEEQHRSPFSEES